MINRRIDRSFSSRALLHLLLSWFFFLTHATATFALEYQSNKILTQQLKKLAADHRKFVHLESVAKTIGKNDLWRVELGEGKDEERSKRPALLLVAGIEGNDLAGTVSAVAWMEHLAKGYEADPSIRKLLETTTIYVFPRVNPDAVEHFFAKPRVELAVSRQPFDDDSDGLVDEDGPEDLNGDGLVTWMRVEDPEGEFMIDPVEPRLLLKADKSKGEKGGWRLLSEGIDNDKDEAWNEDGPGGVNFNRNFPYNYKFFAAPAGLHPVSEIETRALADFVVAHPNIGIVFTFGAADNLVQTPKGEPGGKRPPTAIHDDDVPFYRELGKAFREALGLKKELTGSNEPGAFNDWLYFHRGRFSLAARPWSPALQLELAKNQSKDSEVKPKDENKPDPAAKAPDARKEEKADSEKAGKKPASPGKSESDNRNEEDRAFLKWIDEHAPELFVPWKEFKHPDFVGKKVEIGGFAPFAKTNPLEKLLEEFAKNHSKFLTDLAGKLPRVGIRKAEAKALGAAVFEVTIQIEN
ncbi:MAG TPA: M14 family metallopeptidase, partial [Candidatus Eisenbacteria bacterium]|nr:M14 family metallopeptidase [Candidatus Eisenbacteria bacterium]